MSNDMISLIFTVNYDDFKNVYQLEFDSVECQYLSIDHTFKYAANTGLLSNGKWIKQYDCLFIVMNEKGFVKGFQFTQ